MTPQESPPTTAPAAPSPLVGEMRWLLLLPFAIARLILTIGWRMAYPFLPALARGLGVDLAAVAWGVTLRSGLGLAGPLFGAIGDAWGRRAAMLLGLALFSGGLLLVLIWPTYAALLAALLLSGAGKLIFDPSMQAYLGDRVPYRRRGLAIALSELSWSGAFLLGMPLVGWLIARGGWVTPFPLLAISALGIGLVLWRILPPDAPSRAERPVFAVGVRSVLTHPSALAGLALGICLSASNEVVNIIYGVWMEGSFGLQVATLGAASAVIGVAELGGEGLVAALVDRVGKRRAILAGMVLNALVALSLPLIGRNIWGALVALFTLYLTFEFAVVSSIPLMTEMVPTARATMMAAYTAALAIGRTLGAPLGTALLGYGLMANALASAVITLTGLTILLLSVRVGQEG